MYDYSSVMVSAGGICRITHPDFVRMGHPVDLERLVLGCCFGAFLFGVEEVEFLAGFEADGFAWGDGDFCAGARIASDAGFAGAYVEDAKAAQFDAIAGCEGLLEAFKNCVDRCFRFIARQARTFDDVMDNILFYQRVHLCL